MVEGVCTICGLRERQDLCSVTALLTDKKTAVQHTEQYARGQVLFAQDTPGETVYGILKGRVLLTMQGQRRSRQAIQLVGPGQMIGHPAVLINELYVATAKAVDEVTACAISKETFLDAVRDLPEFNHQVLARLARDLRASTELLLSLTQHSVKRRTAGLLLFLHQSGSPEQQAEGRVPNYLTRSEMAQLIGSSLESCSRTLSDMNQKGILAVTRSIITIKDLPALKKLSQKP
jgi:CRP/FNR family transcriptional regulator, cyclic AMP receptor protein